MVVVVEGSEDDLLFGDIVLLKIMLICLLLVVGIILLFFMMLINYVSFFVKIWGILNVYCVDVVNLWFGYDYKDVVFDMIGMIVVV